MNKIELNNVLNQKFKHLIEWVENQKEREFEVHHIPVKWSTGQHIDHLRKTTKAVNIGINMNSLILRYKFGKLNRNEMSYEEVKNNYVEKSGDGVVAPPSFTPKEISNSRKKEVLGWLITERDKMLSTVNSKSEKRLSKSCLQHPLLGNLSLREFVMWTAIHTEHHLNLMKKYNTP